MDQQALENSLREKLNDKVAAIELRQDMLTLTVEKQHLIDVCYVLRDEEPFKLDQLVDVCGVDYEDYGYSHWRTEETTESGFSRGVSITKKKRLLEWDRPRFASVYHLLSLQHNHRVRIKVFIEGELLVPSVIDVWPSANWYEREAFDLYGIIYEGHPDLRRLLTDYGFIGYPFRKDFPLIGEVSLRYDAKQQRCVYEPINIVPRVLVPKVIRKDNRYVDSSKKES